MGIARSQLETWSTLPDRAASARTYEAVRGALLGSPRLRGHDVSIYLQGSYANATNTRADSDVDVVAEVSSIFYADISRLSPADRARYEQRRGTSSYGWASFRGDVIDALADEFGLRNVDTTGNKSLKVAAGAGRLACDVVPAATHRVYLTYPEYGTPSYYEGIRFWTQRDDRQVVNYPKLHIANGQAKNKVASEYKASVRTMKNARRVACQAGYLADGVAPSYFLESLLSNAPDELFSDNRVVTFLELLSWGFEAMVEETYLSCGNRVQSLFGPTPEQWDRSKASETLSALLAMWKDA